MVIQYDIFLNIHKNIIFIKENVDLLKKHEKELLRFEEFLGRYTFHKNLKAL